MQESAPISHSASVPNISNQLTREESDSKIARDQFYQIRKNIQITKQNREAKVLKFRVIPNQKLTLRAEKLKEKIIKAAERPVKRRVRVGIITAETFATNRVWPEIAW